MDWGQGEQLELGQILGEEAENSTSDDEIEIGEYEVVRPEFFAQIKEPAFTVNVDKISVNTACVRLLPDVEYVQILVNRKEKKLVLLPCEEAEITGYRWGKTKDGRRYSSQRTGEPFVLTLCKLMGWNPDYRYKVLGKIVHSKGKPMVAFDLTSYKCFPKTVTTEGKKVSSRRALFSNEWSGRFGPTYAESHRSLEVKTFDGYTVLTIKNGEVTQDKEPVQPEDKDADRKEEIEHAH